MKRLGTVLLGLGDDGRLLQQAVASEPALELLAVADRDRELADQAAGESDVRVYDDYRQAIVESAAAGAAVALAALPPFDAEEYLPVAAQNSLAVFARPPVARVFDGAVKLAALFEQAQRPLVIGRSWQFEPAFMRLHNLADLAGPIGAAVVDVRCPMSTPTGWLADNQRAGGGVLLHEAYDLVDAVVRLLGVPEEVFAALGKVGVEGAARSYDTEDAASVVFRYTEARTASIACQRAASPSGWSLRLCGAKATLELGPERMRVLTGDEQSAIESPVRTRNRFAPALSVFVSTLAAGVQSMPSTVAEHLATAATLQAAYLAAKTGQPESPGRLLELARTSHG